MSTKSNRQQSIRQHIVSSLIVLTGMVMIGILLFYIFIPFAEFLQDQLQIQVTNSDYVIG